MSKDDGTTVRAQAAFSVEHDGRYWYVVGKLIKHTGEVVNYRGHGFISREVAEEEALRVANRFSEAMNGTLTVVEEK